VTALRSSAATPSTRALSIASGPPLASEPGLGALTLPGYLREVTERFGPREALVRRTAGGAERWSYAELWERSHEVARALIAAGHRRHARVGVLMTNRPEFLAAVFGAVLAGAVAVPLSTFSTAPELDYLLRVSGISTLLFEPRVLATDFRALLVGLEPALAHAAPAELHSLRFPALRRVAAVDPDARGGAIEAWSAFLAPARSVPAALVDATAASVRPSDTGMLFFSSGSTAEPKGILNAHRAVTIQLWRWHRLYDNTGSDLRCWAANGFFWSGVFSMALGLTLSSGGALVLQPTFAAAEALELMQAEAVNIPLCWPHQWARLAEAPNWKDVDLGALRHVDHRSPLAQHPSVRTQWIEPKGYGVSETFTAVVGHLASARPEEIGDSFGAPLPGNTIAIVDPETGSLLPRGERGEIAVKGPTLMQGYVGVPLDETLDADGFFHTGDGGFLDDAGRLHWEGRLSDVIKTGGANVSPREVDALLVSYPGVKLAQTVGVPHATLGEIVVSCAVPQDDAALDEGAMRSFLRERLASYKVPRRILLFRDEELALTGSAKVKSSALRELAAARLASAGEPAASDRERSG
jgi:acyl-CoA synthetase (AMP-forming)/AMP-acid ligase II